MDEVFRSLLFVPGSRSDRFEKAIASGADCVCIDLEDAVAPHQKDDARQASLDYLAKPPCGAVVGLRINGRNTHEFGADIRALAFGEATPAFIVIPKTVSDEDIVVIREMLGANCPPLWALVETPEGILNAADIARAVGPDGGVMFGGVDYASLVGSDMSWDALLFARSSIVNAAAIIGCATLDCPYLDTNDADGLESETRRVRSLGFTGRACIHPKQVLTVNSVFTPTIQEIEQAERICAAFENAKSGAALLDGKLVEKPVLRSARRTLDRMKRINNGQDSQKSQ